MNRVVMPGIFLMCCMVFTSCNKKPPQANPPVPVNIIKVAAQRVYYYDKYPATVEALNQVNIYPEVQGYITGILFKDGAHVRKGQKLYEIDGRLYQAAYDQALANLKAAQNNQVQAQQDADRYTYLNNQNAVAKQLYDHAIIALQVAKSNTAAAEQAAKAAQTNLGYAFITAPFDGTIGFSQVRLGNMVSIGQTILNTISTDDPMAVDFLINEKQLPAFEKFEAGKNIVDSLFTILMPDNSLFPSTGKISVIDRAVDPQTGAIRVRLVFPNPQYVLRAGMSCVVRVHNLESTPVLLVPGKAIVEQMGEYFVFIAKDTAIAIPDSTLKKEEKADKNIAAEPHPKVGKDSVLSGPRLLVFQKKVQLGQTIGPNVIIESGIEQGDSLVVDGVQLLHDGSKVTLGNGVPQQQGPKGGTGKGKSAEEKSAANKKE